MNSIKLLSIIAGALLFTVSCEDVFDVERVGSITPDEMWNSPTFIEKYVNNFYSIMPSWNRLDTKSDEANVADITTDDFLKGKLLSTNSFPGQVWNYSYVRNLNEFFAKMKSTKAPITQSDRPIFSGLMSITGCLNAMVVSRSSTLCRILQLIRQLFM
jgi:hypothetical protein